MVLTVNNLTLSVQTQVHTHILDTRSCIFYTCSKRIETLYYNTNTVNTSNRSHPDDSYHCVDCPINYISLSKDFWLITVMTNHVLKRLLRLQSRNIKREVLIYKRCGYRGGVVLLKFICQLKAYITEKAYIDRVLDISLVSTINNMEIRS